MNDGSCRYHRAPWVLPVSGPPISDGVVAVSGSRIVDVGPSWRFLRRGESGGGRWREHENAVLMPGLVNAHTHLDWSGLYRKIPETPPGFARWVRDMVQVTRRWDGSKRQRALDLGRRELHDSGTVLYANVMNPPVELLAPISEPPVELRFLEVLGFHLKRLKEVFPDWDDTLFSEGTHVTESLAAHSLYAVSPELIREAKEWTRRRKRPFSIHVAEHLEEVAFVRSGTGFCRRLLEFLGRWDPRWTPPGTSPVEALDAMGVLDEKTLLVHAVHVLGEDWDRIARRRSTVCFCVRSNRFIEGTLPMVEEALRRNINVALGTDSRASNEDLNLFREAVEVLERFPRIDPEEVLKMITINGARALGFENRWGALAPGFCAPFLEVRLDQMERSEKDLIVSVLHSAASGRIQWISG